jgi:hypothetical protein
MVSQEEVSLLDPTGSGQVSGQPPKTRASHLRVRVVDTSLEARPAVNIKIPIRVVKFGMKMAQALSPELKGVNLDWESITAMIEDGELGTIVEVEDEAEHKTVEVWVE